MYSLLYVYVKMQLYQDNASVPNSLLSANTKNQRKNNIWPNARLLFACNVYIFLPYRMAEFILELCYRFDIDFMGEMTSRPIGGEQSGAYLIDLSCGASTIYYSDTSNGGSELYVHVSRNVQQNQAKLTIPNPSVKKPGQSKILLAERKITMRQNSMNLLPKLQLL